MTLNVKDGATVTPISEIKILNNDGQGAAPIDIQHIKLSENGGANPNFQTIWEKNTGLVNVAVILSPRLNSYKGIDYSYPDDNGMQPWHIVVVPKKEIWYDVAGTSGIFETASDASNTSTGTISGTLEDVPFTTNDNAKPVVSVYRGSAAMQTLRSKIDILTFETITGKTIAELTSKHTTPTVLVIKMSVPIHGNIFDASGKVRIISNDLANLKLSYSESNAALKTYTGTGTVPFTGFTDIDLVNGVAETWTPDYIEGMSGWGFARDVNYYGITSISTLASQVSMANANFRVWKLRPYLSYDTESNGNLLFISNVDPSTKNINETQNYGLRKYPGVNFPHSPYAIAGGAISIKRDVENGAIGQYGNFVENNPIVLKFNPNNSYWFVHGNFSGNGEPKSRAHGMGFHDFKSTGVSPAGLHLVQGGTADTSAIMFQVRADNSERRLSVPETNTTGTLPDAPNKSVIAMWDIRYLSTNITKFKALGKPAISLTGSNTLPAGTTLPFRLGGVIRPQTLDAITYNDSGFADTLNSKHAITSFVAFGWGNQNTPYENGVGTENAIIRCMDFAAKEPAMVLDILLGGDKKSVYVIFNKILTGNTTALLNNAFSFIPEVGENAVSSRFTGITVQTLTDYYTVYKLTTTQTLTVKTHIRFTPQTCDVVDGNGVKPCGFQSAPINIPSLSFGSGEENYSGINLRTLFTNRYPMLANIPITVRFTQTDDVIAPETTTGAIVTTGYWPEGSRILLNKQNRLIQGGNGNTDVPNAYGPGLEVLITTELDNTNGTINAGVDGISWEYEISAISGTALIEWVGLNNGTLNSAVTPSYIITIPHYSLNVNLRELFIQQYPTRANSIVNVTFNVEDLVGAYDDPGVGQLPTTVPKPPAIKTGSGWPAGCTLRLNNVNGRIFGQGGTSLLRDLAMFPTIEEAAQKILNGGTAIEVTYPLTIDNTNGIIGGGGGAGSNAFYYNSGIWVYGPTPSGGGGRGAVPGYSYNGVNSPPANSTVHATVDQPGIGIHGAGNGGDLGQDGWGFTPDNNVQGTIGAGKAGKSIIGLNLVTWINMGTILGPTVP